MAKTLVTDSTDFQNCITGGVILANGTTVATGNMATLLDVTTVGSDVQVTLSYHLQYPEFAWNPSPADGIDWVEIESTLSWSAGDNAISHDVYFGTDETAVTNAQRLAGDFNGNGTVDIDDLRELASGWLTSADLEDFATLAAD